MKFLVLYVVLILQKLIYALADDGCINVKLDNGYVKARTRKSQMITFTCEKSFTLVGSASARCVSGNWSSPVPFCAKTNCESPSILHGYVNFTYDGAVATFRCDPEFTLLGSGSLLCSPTGWNGPIPSCQDTPFSPLANSLSKFGTCHFESTDPFQCKWIRKDGMCRWRIWVAADVYRVGKRDSSALFDHTLGPHTGGHYLDLESAVSVKPGLKNDAEFISPLYPPIPPLEKWCLIFFVYSFGPFAGDIYVVINNETRWQNHERSNKWRKVTVPLNYITSPFRIVIGGRRPSIYNVTAIDDLTITNGTRCRDNSDGELPYTVEPDRYANVPTQRVTSAIVTSTVTAKPISISTNTETEVSESSLPDNDTEQNTSSSDSESQANKTSLDTSEVVTKESYKSDKIIISSATVSVHPDDRVREEKPRLTSTAIDEGKAFSILKNPLFYFLIVCIVIVIVTTAFAIRRQRRSYDVKEGIDDSSVALDYVKMLKT